MAEKGRLQTVVRIETERRWSETAGSLSREVEVLVCGHRFVPRDNPHFGGTDLGERKILTWRRSWAKGNRMDGQPPWAGYRVEEVPEDEAPYLEGR